MSNNPRSPKEEAIRLCNLYGEIMYGTKTNPHKDTLVKTQARATVIAIVKALHITTGHLTLNEVDQIEASRDIQYWREVEFQINVL